MGRTLRLATLAVALAVAPAAHAQNLPPFCADAFSDVAELWPPNHAMRQVAVDGVTDPDGDPVSITVTAIAQDEPNDACEGDATGLGTDVVALRAEREGSGDGRVYHVAFVATDPFGATCAGEITVCVPHDQRPDSACVDGGPLYDSIVQNGGVCGDDPICDPDLCLPDDDVLCDDLPPGVERKLARARALLDRATSAERPRRRARLTRRADRFLARADAQAARVLDGACLVTVGTVLDDARSCCACVVARPD